MKERQKSGSGKSDIEKDLYEIREDDIDTARFVNKEKTAIGSLSGMCGLD